MIIRRVDLVGEDEGARDIVVSGPTIARVGDVSAVARPRDGPVLDFGRAIAFPGLTNSHDHLEFNIYPPLRHRTYAHFLEWGEDIHARDGELISRLERIPLWCRVRWGALKNLLCGVTTVVQHGDALDELTDLPIDAVRATSIHSVCASRRWRWRLNGPIDRSPYVFHVGEGTSPDARHEIDQLIRWNLFRRSLIGVHGIAMLAEQAAHFRAVVWCPLSNEFLYGATADVASLKRRTAILLGTDSTLTADWNFWNHLRRARALHALDDRELFDAVTRTAALAWRLPKGSNLAAGLSADLVVARKKEANCYDAFFALEPEDILLVLRRGALVLCDSSLENVPLTEPVSVVRVNGTEKLVALDVPGIVAGIRECGVEPNIAAITGGSVSYRTLGHGASGHS